MSGTLRINEIFYSLQGESTYVGLPTVFIRLTGCPLRCQYCDTAYAFHSGNKISIDDILNEVGSYSAKAVTVSGGEPLAQPNVHILMSALCDMDYQVSIETSGALDISQIDPRVKRIVDLKTPGSGEESKNLWENLNHLNQRDEVKFVICDQDDYEWAKDILSKRKLHGTCEVLFSPSYQEMPEQKLADLILADQLPVRFQVQLHKYIWGDVAGK